MTLEVLLDKRLVLFEDLRVVFGELGEYLLSVLHLHQRCLQRLDCVQNLSFQIFILNNIERLLKYIVAKLVVN